MKNIFKTPIVKTLLIIFIGINIILLSVNFFLMPWYVKLPEVKVPRVLGESEYSAIQSLTEAGLTPILGDTVYNDKHAKGTIVLQKPKAGEVVKEGRRIYLVVSGGEQSVYVPLLRGKSLRDAKFALDRIGLKLGEVNEQPSNTPKDIVIDQQFLSGTPLKKGKTISLTISIGSEEGNIEVPDLVGRSFAEAERILNGMLLRVGQVSYQPSFSLLPNTIIDQYPSRGTKLSEGDKVDLFVTKNVETTDEINLD
ncbi:MAG: PASTA domain-containing protein [Ignavibacteria bacterium]|nr:PASTA domain-containing protein [Ignavibacteria bacterium]